MISKNQIKFVRQLEQKKYRQKEGLFVAEGPKVVGDLLRHGWQPKALYATSAWEGVSGMTGSGMVQVSAEELQRLSFLQHPQQVLAVFPMPENREMPPLKQGRLYLALDGVQDPGNLGTIIRIADWFGINAIYCSTDTADVWNPKVVQATMGSIARVSLYYTDLPQMLKSVEVPVYGTLLDGEDIYSQSLSSDGVIVMGNEGNGLSAAVRELVDRKLLIPSFNSSPDMAESLNVAIATAITCSEFRRR